MASMKEQKKMLSDLRKSVKALRDAHVGKSLTKMSAEELAREKSHHETAVRAMEVKARRMEGLAKAREARGKASSTSERGKLEPASKPAGESKTTERSKVVAPKKVAATAKKTETTIGDLVEEKKSKKKE